MPACVTSTRIADYALGRKVTQSYFFRAAGFLDLPRLGAALISE